MASKQELEAKVAELEAKIAALKDPMNPATADPSLLQDVLNDAVEKNRADYEEKLSKASKEKSELEGQLGELNSKVENLLAERAENQELLKKMAQKIDEAVLENDVLTKKLNNRKAGVVINGEAYDVVQNEKMLDLVDMWRKRYVQDDDLVVVLKKA